MARTRVNTKFVLGLAGVLALGGGAIASVYTYRSWQNKNPDVLRSKADAQLAKGNWEPAIGYLGRAAAASKSAPGADALWERYADLCFDHSKGRSDLYLAALSGWSHASTIRPDNVPVLEKRLRETLKFSRDLMRSPFFQTRHALPQGVSPESVVGQLARAADAMIAQDKNHAVAYAARGFAGSMGQPLVDDTKGTVAKARADLETAYRLTPENPLVTLMLSEYELRRAAALYRATLGADARRLQEATLARLDAYVAKHPDETEVIALWATLRLQMNAATPVAAKLETAAKAHPGDRHLAERHVAELLRAREFKAAEDYLLKTVENNPGDNRALYDLGRYYGGSGNMAEATKVWQRIYEAKEPGTGTCAVLNDHLKQLALEELPRMHMDQARIEGLDTPKGQASLETAAALVDRLRAKSPTDPYVSLLDGRLTFLRGKTAQAIDQLKRADDLVSTPERIKAMPRNYFLTKTYLAEAYFKTKDYTPALQCYEAILREDAGNVRAQMDAARVYLMLRRYDDVIRITQNLLKIDPRATEALVLQAQAYEGLGQYGKVTDLMMPLGGSLAQLQAAIRRLTEDDAAAAHEILAPVLAKEPDHEGANYLDALALMKLEKRDEATKILTRLVERNPQNTRYRYALEWSRDKGANQLDLQKRVIETIENPYERAIAWSGFHRMHGDAKEELKALHEAEKIRPESVDLIEPIFIALLETKDYTTAARYVSKAAAANVDGLQGKLYQGQLELARGERKSALETLQAAVAARPEHAMARTALGRAHVEMQQYDQATAQFSKAIELRPDDIVAIRQIIPLLLLKGDDSSRRRAEDYLRKGLSFARNDRVLRGYEDSIGDVDAALARRAAIQKREPENVDNILRLAMLHVRKAMSLGALPANRAAAKKSYDEAVALVEPLAAAKPDDLMLADRLGRLYRDSGRTNDALKVYQRFLTSEDTRVRDDAKLCIARMYRSLNQLPEAVGVYKEIEAVKSPAGTMLAARELGDLYFELNDLEGARRSYKAAYEGETEKDPRVLRRFVEATIRAGLFKEADEILTQRILSQKPNDEDGLVLSGFSLLRQGNPREALKRFGKVLETSPRNADALYYRAYSQFSLQGNLKQAVDDLLAVKQVDEKRIEARLLLARVYRLLRRFTESVSEYRAVGDLAPDNASARLELAEYLQSLVAAQRALPEGARDADAVNLRALRPAEALAEVLAAGAQRFPSQPRWPLMAAEEFLAGGNAPEAIATLQKALSSFPDNPRVGAAYLNALVRGSRWDEAIAYADKAVAQWPRLSEGYMFRAVAHAAKGKGGEAQADLNRAFSLMPEVAQVAARARELVPLVEVKFLTGVFDMRVKELPNDINGRIALGNILMGTNRAGDVTSALEPALALPELARSENVAARIMVLRLLADASFAQRKFAQALKYYDQILAVVPDDLEALNNSAYVLAEEMTPPQPKEALVRGEKALESLQRKPVELVYTTHGNVMDTYGWILYKNEKYKEAREVLDRAIQTDPQGLTYYHLARTLEALGLMPEAKRAAEDAVRIGESRSDGQVDVYKSYLESLRKKR